jgi:hypothetical protein
MLWCIPVDNLIGDLGARALANALVDDAKLLFLNLAGAPFDFRVGPSFRTIWSAEWVQWTTANDSVVAGNKIADAGAAALSRCVERNQVA